MSDRDSRAVPDWQLERFRLQELPPEEMAALAAALATDAGLVRRLETLASDDRRILEELPPRTLAAAVRARHARASTPGGRRLASWQPALVASAVLVLAVGVTLLVPGRGPTTSDPARLEPTRIKGLRPELLLFRKTAGGAEALTTASVARPGDVVQLAYRAAGQRYGVIVSVDSRGTVTPHLPRRGRRAAELLAGASVPLGSAYELDDAPRWEAFYFVVATDPFDLELIVDAARDAASAPANPASSAPARLALPAGFEQSAFFLRKDLPR